ncbi:hypothetical protein ABPG72_018433 [Tetrahymena utriculariae]
MTLSLLKQFCLVAKTLQIIKNKQENNCYLLEWNKHRDQTDSQNFVYDYYKMEVCQDASLVGYFCVNFNKQLSFQNNYSKTSVELNYNNTKDQQDKLILIWSLCDKRYNGPGEACEDDANIVKAQMISLNTQITVQIKLNQFNPLTKQIESKWKSETYLIDSFLSLVSSIKLKLDNAIVIDRLVIQKTQKMSYINDYSNVDTTLTQDFISKYFNLKIDSQKFLQSYKIQYDINFKDQFKRIFEVGIIRRLQLFFISSSQQDLLKSKSITQEQSILLLMIGQFEQYSNVFYIQRQILEIQNMLKLFFSEQQYAAVKLCGMKLQQNYSQITNNQIENNMTSQNQVKSNTINQRQMKNVLTNQNQIEDELIKQNFLTENKNNTQNQFGTQNLQQNLKITAKEDVNIELQKKDQYLNSNFQFIKVSLKSLDNIQNYQIIAENQDNPKNNLSINNQEKYQENSSSSLQNIQKQENQAINQPRSSQAQFNELNTEQLKNKEGSLVDFILIQGILRDPLQEAPIFFYNKKSLV